MNYGETVNKLSFLKIKCKWITVFENNIELRFINFI